MSKPLLKYRQPTAPQDILTEAVPARLYTKGSGLNLVRAALFGVSLDKVKDVVELLKSYRGGKPNSIPMGNPLGWSWYATIDTTHHGSLAGPANAHRHADLASIGIDDHHARDHAARHASGQPDAVSLDASQIGTGQFSLTRLPRAASGQFLEGNGVAADPIYNALVAADIPSLDVAKITTGIFVVARGGTGLGTIATGGILYASALDTLSRIAPSAANQVLRSTGANALQIASLVAADIPNLDAAKITSGRFGMARMSDGTSGQVLTAQGSGVDPIYKTVPPQWHTRQIDYPVLAMFPNSGDSGYSVIIEYTAIVATTPAVINNDVYFYSLVLTGLLSSGKITLISIPILYIGRNSNQNIWVRFAATVADPPSETVAHFGWKIIGGDLYASCANGTNQTIVDTGIDITTGYQETTWQMIMKQGVSCEFYVDRVLRATITTNLPATGNYRYHTHLRAFDAEGKNIRLGSISIAEEF